jgi:AraC-like DNA-binding protein
VEAAKKAFESSRKTVNEVMYDVGYSDVKAFREVFHRVTGLSPLEYRNRYNTDSFDRELQQATNSNNAFNKARSA